MSPAITNKPTCLRATSGISVVVAGCILSWGGMAEARVAGYSHLDNETIGTFNVIKRAVAGPAEQFDGLHWAPDLLDSMASDDAMGPLRYVIAFSSYAVAQAATRTPAWRQPYRDVMDALIRKMLQHKAWDDWLKRWGDNPLGPDNIMYTGHLLYMMTLHRQVFGDTSFEEKVKLNNPGGPEFETDVQTLAASIAGQAANYADAAGALTYNIACEPGRIFLPCNEPHRVAQISFDRIYGTQFAASNAAWLKWTRERLHNTEHGVLHDLFYPFGSGESVAGAKEPEVHKRLSGVYNGWSIWMLAALDAAWAQELYPAYKTYFVVSGTDSPKSDGRTMVLDRTGATGLAGDALDLIATGFGMVAARQFADEALYEQLDATWSLNFGEPKWSDDGAEFLRSFPLIPLVIQNGFALLATTTTAEVNLATLAQAPWQPERFAHPYLRSVGDKTVFVNQAVYDTATETLLVTLNGGAATATSVELSLANLDKSQHYEVRRDDVKYADWRWQGDSLVIQTPPLSAVEESYTVVPTAAPAEAGGCAAGAHHGGGGLPLWGMLMCFVAIVTRFTLRRDPRRAVDAWDRRV